MEWLRHQTFLEGNVNRNQRKVQTVKKNMVSGIGIGMRLWNNGRPSAAET
jgi:hypothetical protein